MEDFDFKVTHVVMELDDSCGKETKDRILQVFRDMCIAPLVIVIVQ